MTNSEPQRVERQPIPKKLRFDVFKRDSFKCQYCGASAPDVLLHVDHIKPVAAGGTNDITNLITSCASCNLGKRDKPLDDNSAVKKRKAQLDELQDRREQIEMMMDWMEGLRDLQSQAIARLSDYWGNLAPGFVPNDRGRQKIRKWLTKFSIEEIMRAMDASASTYLEFPNDGQVTKESWETAFNKIQPILNVERDSKTDPDLKDILYIRGILRNRCENYFSNTESLKWLRNARSWGIPMTELKQLAYEIYSWNHFVKEISALIDEYRTSQRG
ncbi:MAG TPA: HNH endonuclease signature motif containing protein [Candidatus Hydrogenedentes bacterium]|nr:HNH endonuclease signature motif containing protein [Candidatus Hydrogenedentota bacterium]